MRGVYQSAKRTNAVLSHQLFFLLEWANQAKNFKFMGEKWGILMDLCVSEWPLRIRVLKKIETKKYNIGKNIYISDKGIWFSSWGQNQNYNIVEKKISDVTLRVSGAKLIIREDFVIHCHVCCTVFSICVGRWQILIQLLFACAWFP